MDRQQILLLLKSRKRTLKKYGVRSLSVFGSVARNRVKNTAMWTYWLNSIDRSDCSSLRALRSTFEKVLGRKVDLVTPQALRKELRGTILREAIGAA